MNGVETAAIPKARGNAITKVDCKINPNSVRINFTIYY
ncbi:hypothetical protein Nizo2257_2620 [Lactiplantibacillus plantarum]|nr:hypothetical protein Nizo2257_2620 [Lactiplantibacillus plantarum]KZU00876.1 hypothetical protein Nizo2258_0209 [Lactiplantibacillus plantarum]